MIFFIVPVNQHTVKTAPVKCENMRILTAQVRHSLNIYYFDKYVNMNLSIQRKHIPFNYVALRSTMLTMRSRCVRELHTCT